jgi:hypothetical protein
MSSTVKVSDTLGWLAGFIVQRPTTGVGGVAKEPALTSANKILQTILGPPFKWNWNRAETTFSTVVGQTDYEVALSDFGYVEKATAYLATSDPPQFELEVYQVLAKDGKNNPPQRIAPLLDDGAGNITFRLFPPPDDVYTITPTIQKGAPLLTDTAGLWSPVPDRYAYLYEQGMLGMLQGMYSAQLYAVNMEMFFRQLVAACEALTETERAIFLEDRLRDVRAGINATQKTQMGNQARF